jgi:hypothetical protein
MSENLKAALIVPCSLIAASILFGGIYESRSQVGSMILWHVNRFTGNVEATILNTGGRPDPSGRPICIEAAMTK